MTKPIYALTDTWNAGATTFVGIGIDVTDTASAAASLLLSLKLGGTEKFGVKKDGSLTQPLLLQQTDYAAAGTTQGTATAVTTDVVRITSGTADQGIVLPAAIGGRNITIINDTSSRLKVYPASGEKWGAQGSLSAANASAYLPAGTVVIVSGTTGVWYSPGLYQFAAGTFGLGSMMTNGQGGGGSITRLFTPAGNLLVSLNESDGSLGSFLQLTGTTVLVSNASPLRFANGGVSYIGGMFPSATPDLTIKAANSAGGTEYAVMRFSSPASAVNKISAVSSATGNGVKLEAEGTDSNIDMQINPKGTGSAQFGGGSWAANGSVATSLGSVGPTGSHTTVQEWFAVKNASGTVRYIPGF